MAPLSQRLARDDRGAAVIELAMVAPILALMTIGVVDISNAYGRKLALEQGAHRAIEKIMQTTGTDTVSQTLKNEAVCQVNGTNDDGSCKTIPITSSNVTITYRLECQPSGSTAFNVQSSVDEVAFDDFECASKSDKESRYIDVKITDKYAPLFPVHFSGFTEADGTYHITAQAGMRTE